MRSRSRFSTAPSPRPSDGDLTVAVDYAHLLVDTALQTLLILSPDTSTWEVPIGAVDAATWKDERLDRARNRVREVQARLRANLPARHHPDLDDLDDAMARGLDEAAGVGWRLGMSVSRRTVGLA